VNGVILDSLAPFIMSPYSSRLLVLVRPIFLYIFRPHRHYRVTRPTQPGHAPSAATLVRLYDLGNKRREILCSLLQARLAVDLLVSVSLIIQPHISSSYLL
jgi:hypothetical protein